MGACTEIPCGSIECPYTGKTVRVEYNLNLGVYYQKGAWSPNRVFADLRDAKLQMLRRGRVFLEGEPRCPYTGREVTFEKVPGGWKPVGAYDPDRISANQTELLFWLTMRDGMSAEGTMVDENFGKPTEGLRVTHEEDRKPVFELEQVEQQKAAAKEAAEVIAETVVREFRKKKGLKVK